MNKRGTKIDRAYNPTDRKSPRMSMKKSIDQRGKHYSMYGAGRDFVRVRGSSQGGDYSRRLQVEGRKGTFKIYCIF